MCFMFRLMALAISCCLFACQPKLKTEFPSNLFKNSSETKAPMGMVFIPSSEFNFGSDYHYPEEAPSTRLEIPAFFIDIHEVTNRQFKKFIDSTGYVTVAERPARKTDTVASLNVEKLGSAIFVTPEEQFAQRAGWWAHDPNANWEKPFGIGSSIETIMEHPVVHVTYEDAVEYAKWKGRELPSEAQWELAGSDAIPWRKRDGKIQYHANTWQGVFPRENKNLDSHFGTAPVMSYNANKFGLYDMVGNVWEITKDFYAPNHIKSQDKTPHTCSKNSSHDPKKPGATVRVIKGGSFLCAQNYCRRYRVTARSSQDVTIGASNVGFRTVLNPENGFGQSK